MILIDNEKAVMVGEGKQIIKEMAAIMDRLFSELEVSSDGKLQYDETVQRFLGLIEYSRELRETQNLNPIQIASKEESDSYFNLGDSKFSGNQILSKESAEDALKKAMSKMSSNSPEKKKKKKKKKEKKENKKDSKKEF